VARGRQRKAKRDKPSTNSEEGKSQAQSSWYLFLQVVNLILLILTFGVNLYDILIGRYELEEYKGVVQVTVESMNRPSLEYYRDQPAQQRVLEGIGCFEQILRVQNHGNSQAKNVWVQVTWEKTAPYDPYCEWPFNSTPIHDDSRTLYRFEFPTLDGGDEIVIHCFGDVVTFFKPEQIRVGCANCGVRDVRLAETPVAR